MLFASKKYPVPLLVMVVDALNVLLPVPASLEDPVLVKVDNPWNVPPFRQIPPHTAVTSPVNVEPGPRLRMLDPVLKIDKGVVPVVEKFASISIPLEKPRLPIITDLESASDEVPLLAPILMPPVPVLFIIIF